MKAITNFASFVLVLLLPMAATAATVTSQVRFWDDRVFRDGTSAHKLDTADLGTNQKVTHHKVYVYDQDGSCNDYSGSCGENDDDLLATVVTSASGWLTVYNVGTAEDVYFLTRYESQYGSAPHTTQAVLGTGAALVAVSATKHNIGGNYHRDWNISCPGDANGYCVSGQVTGNDATTNWFANIAQTMAEVARWSGTNFNSHGRVYGHFGQPYWNNSKCFTGGSNTGNAYGWDRFCVRPDRYSDNTTIAHEMGHLAHKRSMNTSSGTLAGSSPSGGWSTEGGEKWATSEGFADFWYLATYWEKWSANPTSRTRKVEGDTAVGNSGVSLRCVSNNHFRVHRMRGNVARFFWDLYDSTTEDDDGNDTLSYSLSSIVGTWDYFPWGTGNRQSHESDDHGRNIHDYQFYAPNVTNVQSHNCLIGQEDF